MKKSKIYLLLSTNLRFYDSKAILTPQMVLPHHASKFVASKRRFFPHDFTLITSVVGESVIGHGIGGINFPDKMARLAKCKIAGVSDDRPSASPDLKASQITDG